MKQKTKRRISLYIISTLCASLLGNLLTRKGTKIKIPGRGVIAAGEGNIRAGQDF